MVFLAEVLVRFLDLAIGGALLYTEDLTHVNNYNLE